MRKFSSLSRELENKNSPIHAYVKENFPNTAALARMYKKEQSELVVPTILPIDGNRSSTIGDAFDLVARFTAAPDHYPEQALSFALTPNLLGYGEDLAEQMRNEHLDSGGELTEFAAKVCWYLALTTQAYRVGIPIDSPLADYADVCLVEDVLYFAQPEDIEELQSLHSVAQTSLYPLFAEVDRNKILPGPDFAGSEYCRADADLIIDGTLLEIKTRIGRKNKSGIYEDALRPEDTRAVLGYVLFDLEDEYHLEEVAFYSARYGKLFRIELDEFLGVLAGKPVNLEEARADMRRILEG